MTADFIEDVIEQLKDRLGRDPTPRELDIELAYRRRHGHAAQPKKKEVT